MPPRLTVIDGTKLRLYTNRYSNFDPDQGVPVRTSRGVPRFKLRYQLAYNAPMLAPPAAILRVPDRVYFRQEYRDHLDHHGPDRVRANLQDIANDAGNHQLVLMCFETLPKSWCHRTLFAEWWRDRTGEVVPELQPGSGYQSPVEVPDVPTLPLF